MATRPILTKLARGHDGTRRLRPKWASEENDAGHQRDCPGGVSRPHEVAIVTGARPIPQAQPTESLFQLAVHRSGPALSSG